MKNANHHSRRSRRGAVQVEYAFLLVFVVVPAAGAIFMAGAQMYPNYKTARAAILGSNP